MKRILLILTVSIFGIFTTQAQDLADHIPDSAGFVMKINIPEILKNYSLEELEASQLGKELLKTVKHYIRSDANSFEDLGIDLTQPQYIFVVVSNMEFQLAYLLPVKDPEIMRKDIENKYGDIDNDNGVILTKAHGRHYALNDKLLSIVYSEKQHGNNIKQEPWFMREAANPVSESKDYRKAVKKDALLSMYMGNIGKLMEAWGVNGNMPEDERIILQGMTSIYKQYESMSINLTTDEKETRLNYSIRFDRETGKRYGRMTKGKLNKEFLRNIDLANSMGFMTFNFNVENSLKEYPELMKDQFDPIITPMGFKSETHLVLEIMKTVIDEKAIGELIKGDMLIALSGIYDNEVEYIEYEYDDNMNRREVKKTKTEKIPGFIAMASTKEGEITRLTTELLLKYKLMENRGGYYSLKKTSEIPFEVFFAIKNDVVYLGTSENDFKTIVTGQGNGSIPSTLKKYIRKSQMTMFASLSELEAIIPEKEKTRDISELIRETPDVYFYTKTSGNTTMTSHLVIETPEGHKNGIDYLMSVLKKITEK